MEKPESKTNKKPMTILIIVSSLFFAGIIVWFLSPKNININRNASPPETNRGKSEFTNEGAAEFIYNRLQQVNPSAKREAVMFVVEKEWEWQYANAPKTDSNLTLIQRTDKRLLNHLVEESNKARYNLNEEEVRLILKYLEDYEDSLAK